MINLEISRPFRSKVNRAKIREAIRHSLSKFVDPETVELTVKIDSDELIKDLNFQYNGIEKPTDVLSFPADEIDPQTGRKYLGDVLVSYPRAEYQAAKFAHPVDDEVDLLIVHAILHLFGYDHIQEAEKEEMWEIQNQILNELGCQIVSYEPVD